MTAIPEKYDHTKIEESWSKAWEKLGIYLWDETRPREETFVVDTPPPTVSGSLHVGHVFSYTQTDVVVRYQRMLGKNIMYPMGWDDNGLATERRVQNKFGITCNPELPYQPGWAPKDADGKNVQEISRKNFIEACSILTVEDEAAFEKLWRHLSLSVDWTQQYATIDSHCRRTSQLSFLDLVNKGMAYASEAPTMWDVGFQTALAQADLEDRPMKGAYHDVRFGVEGGGEFIISTTRPELLVACIGVVAHPDDARYAELIGKNAITPLFGAKVPIRASAHVDPEKGSGIMMTCTFGDIADVDWWKSSGLPIKQVIEKNGRFRPISFREEPFTSLHPEIAEKAYKELEGKRVVQARKIIAELLANPEYALPGGSPALVSEPKPIEHPVKFYEKGENPVEFITTRQWFIRLLDFKNELVQQGDKIEWHPPHMKSRYTNWVLGLNHDWCISRQRFFGVPFPVWYPVNSQGVALYDQPIFADAAQLPVDPFIDLPKGYTEAQRNQPGGFTEDRDVMDTWATSSLTPQIVSRCEFGEKSGDLAAGSRHSKVFPSDIRPQSHEIIRTWAFYTIAKAWMHDGEVPWHHAVISGWILDPDRKKMSKSKGNVVTPQHLLDEYSADAVRYWAARARLGVDTAFDDKVFVNGRKLVTKLFNASRFVMMQVDSFTKDQGIPANAAITSELDRGLVARLRRLTKEATKSFEAFEYAGALQAVEAEFWSFCDHYVELVKGRAYAEDDAKGRASAVASLRLALSCFCRFFAPFLPYIAEEIWSWRFADETKHVSVHTSRWPSEQDFSGVPEPEFETALDTAIELLGVIHHEKSKQQKSLKWPISKLELGSSAETLAAARSVLPDLVRAGRLDPEAVKFQESAPSEGARFSVKIELSDSAP